MARRVVNSDPNWDLFAAATGTNMDGMMIGEDNASSTKGSAGKSPANDSAIRTRKHSSDASGAGSNSFNRDNETIGSVGSNRNGSKEYDPINSERVEQADSVSQPETRQFGLSGSRDGGVRESVQSDIWSDSFTTEELVDEQFRTTRSSETEVDRTFGGRIDRYAKLSVQVNSGDENSESYGVERRRSVDDATTKRNEQLYTGSNNQRQVGDFRGSIPEESRAERGTSANTSEETRRLQELSIGRNKQSSKQDLQRVVASNLGEVDPSEVAQNWSLENKSSSENLSKRERYVANVEAIRLSRVLDEEDRYATPIEQEVLSKWSSWGSLSEVFDERVSSWDVEREQLRNLLSPSEFSESSTAVLNAHYTNIAYAKAIWQAVKDAGFETGSVLEPGAGAGVFMGSAPENIQMIGVELDSTTARITKHLYPEFEIRGESYVDTRVVNNSFDIALGNVPFGDIVLYDPKHNSTGESIHNHFIIKSLNLLKPGGYAAFITSSYTMDKANATHRQIMAKTADLIATVRLPNGAHMDTADTGALSDVLVFRKRKEGEDPLHFDLSWLNTESMVTEDNEHQVNSIFINHPELVLGDMSVGVGRFGSEIKVKSSFESSQDLGSAIQNALHHGIQMAISRGRGFNAELSEPPVFLTQNSRNDYSTWEGHIDEPTPNEFTIVENGRAIDLKLPSTAYGEMHSLLNLRDISVSLLDLESNQSKTTEEMENLRANLNSVYEKHLEDFGSPNRINLKIKKLDIPEKFEPYIDGTLDLDDYLQEDEEFTEGMTYSKLLSKYEPKITRKLDASLRIFKQDPHASAAMQLDIYDPEKGIAKKSGILLGRVLTPRTPPTRVENPLDAISISLDQLGKIDIDYIAGLLAATVEESLLKVSEHLINDPDKNDELVLRTEYFSGDIYSRLEIAEIAERENPGQYTEHIELLKASIPEKLTAEEIEAKFGSPWIGSAIHQKFLREEIKQWDIDVSLDSQGNWAVKGKTISGVAATDTWGTKRKPSGFIVESLLRGGKIIVVDKVLGDDGKEHQVINGLETTVANAKAKEIQERFSEWIWEDSERTRSLTNKYNRMFNNLVSRDYTSDAKMLSFPGLADSFIPHTHQKIAVARILAEPAVLLAHEVGAGKTSEMIIGAMEQKRLGLINKPCVVIPNHMLEQFSSEWLERYPGANILAVSPEDMTKDNRQQFLLKATLNDWDAIIMTRGAFERIEVSNEFKQKYMIDRITEREEALEIMQANGVKDMSVSQMRNSIEKYREKMKKIMDKVKDQGITFEQTGIDYLFIDEAHDYKNLDTSSAVEFQSSSSGRASDLEMKIQLLRERNGNRVATFATGTPVSNSIKEVYVMQRYLRPDILENADIYNFTNWVATFGKKTIKAEIDSVGNFKMKERLASFDNVPELRKMFSTFADVKLSKDLNLKVPEIALNSAGEHRAEIVLTDPSEDLLDAVAWLQQRADDFKARPSGKYNAWIAPENDNMLAVSSDGRKFALDMRTVMGGDYSPATSKIVDAAQKIYEVYDKHKDNIYLNPKTGKESELKGGLQLVFCDISTPKFGVWNAYQQLKDELLQRGIEADKVRFIHEAKTDDEKAQLFSECRSGKVSVLIASTGKAGTGTNIQDRIVAVHNIDCPWRPADLTQRNGRGIRQGNQNSEVSIFNYATKRSYDTYMWQAVERKEGFIYQFMSAQFKGRSMQDLGDASLSYAEIKAAAADNPLLLKESELKDRVESLERQKIRYTKAKSGLELTIRISNEIIEKTTKAEKVFKELIPIACSTSGENFAYSHYRNPTTLDNKQPILLSDRAQATHAILGLVLGSSVGMTFKQEYNIGQLGGIEINVQMQHNQNWGNDNDTRRRFFFYSKGLTDENPLTSLSRKDLKEMLSNPKAYGLITRLENGIERMQHDLQEVQRTLAKATEELFEAQANLDKPFRGEITLVESRQELLDLQEQIAAQAVSDTKPSSDEASIQIWSEELVELTTEQEREEYSIDVYDRLSRLEKDALAQEYEANFPFDEVEEDTYIEVPNRATRPIGIPPTSMIQSANVYRRR
ncbi:MAG: hypothetical protein LBI63_03260 [Candidatus Ancillula sp.]|jgi:N12 class adenine-specific DNA methylase|nr:hypothetical protein [Candidatus Ancillula sp.]